ncbi:MAG: hypothetical protein HY959_07960 [Ignavibacteriae bacterium]|nr:hypothetical protein [Ignavibacteriota bacterium]
MKKNFLLILISVLFSASLYSQEKQESKWGINFSGFVKTDFIFDSRQTVNAREGHFLFFPQPELPDKNGKDLNAEASFNILSIQTRINGKITGPDAFGAKSSAMIEGEFFGTSDGDINGFRLRHATVNLDWEKTSLMAGQYWHPMFVTDCFPGTVSFNTGAPFQPFSRNPQLRLTQKLSNNFSAIIAAYSERDFQDYGPFGQSSVYLRNAVIPGLHLQLQFKSDKVLFGVSGDYKSLKPRLYTANNEPTDEKVNSMAVEGYAKINLDPVTIKLEGIYGKNLANLFMLGGYAVKSMDSAKYETYTPVNVFSLWGDISGGKEIEIGLFGGYTKNLGADDNVLGVGSSNYFARGTNINALFRLSPRIAFNSGKVKLAFELEYTSAAYGTPNNLNKGKVENTTSVANVRGLMAFFYYF